MTLSGRIAPTVSSSGFNLAAFQLDQLTCGFPYHLAAFFRCGWVDQAIDRHRQDAVSRGVAFEAPYILDFANLLALGAKDLALGFNLVCFVCVVHCETNIQASRQRVKGYFHFFKKKFLALFFQGQTGGVSF